LEETAQVQPPLPKPLAAVVPKEKRKKKYRPVPSQATAAPKEALVGGSIAWKSLG